MAVKHVAEAVETTGDLVIGDAFNVGGIPRLCGMLL